MQSNQCLMLCRFKICKKLKIFLIAYCPLCRGGRDQKQLLGDKIDYQADAILK